MFESSALIAVIAITLIFEYINGFHDSANAIATVVSTRVLSPRKALLFGGIFNFVGAFAGTHVAKTIGQGIVDVECVTQLVIFVALLSAIIWNLITWYFGIPSSSSHALIGGLIGAAMAKSGWKVVHFDGITYKVLIPMVTSPIAGFIAGFIFMSILFWIVYCLNPDKVNTYFRKLQLVSSGIMAFSHGSNDAQKTMGIITLSLYTFGSIPKIEVPLWVIITCATVMGLGTMAGGWRIIRTMGVKVFKLRPIHGFASETAASSVILVASHFGIPISTTHVISTSIMGVGSTRRFSAVKWGLVGRIVQAWVVTIPICIFMAWPLYHILDYFVN